MTGPQENESRASGSRQWSRLEVRVANLDCENEASALRRGLEKIVGLIEVDVFPGSAKVSLLYDPLTVSPEALKERLEVLGFPPVAGLAAPRQPHLLKNPKVLTSLTAGFLLLSGWLAAAAGASVPHPVWFYIGAILLGGYYFGREAAEELIFEYRVGIELLMAVAAVVAALMGQVAEGAVLVFLYSISEAAEGYTEEKTRSAIRALMDLAPKRALVLREGREVELPVESLSIGDRFIVRPGERIATDGSVISGASSVNQAPVTGESVPVDKGPGDDVYAGSINGEGALEVRATRTFAENTISRIIRMVEEAQERKGKSQRFIERFGARYSPAVLLLGLLISLLPPLLFGQSWDTWITRATVFIVAAAPCALVISIPITLVAALGTGARKGVLIKGGVYVEELAKIRVVALDKTGTITRGAPEVVEVRLAPPPRPAGGRFSNTEELVAIAAAVERRSGHPLARAVVRYAEAGGIEPVEASDFRSLTGAGASAEVDGCRVYVGSPHLFEARLKGGLEQMEKEVAALQERGKTVILVGSSEELWGVIALADRVRPNAGKAIADLHAAGVEKVIMLTGDNERTARVIAGEVGIDEFYADLGPEEKAEKVRHLTARYGHLAMVGDGVNDAPALAESTVGVAMGAVGTDVALETADVALMADDLEKLVYALDLARRNRRIVRQNLVLSALVIGVLTAGAVTGLLGLPAAIIGHEVSEFVVIGSGLRMLRA